MAVFRIKNDLSVPMRDALRIMWQRHAGGDADVPLNASQCLATEATMHALEHRGFVEAAGGIRYRMSQRGIYYAKFQFGGTIDR